VLAIRFSGRAFAAVWDVRRCSGFAGIVIGDRVIAARVAASQRVSNNAAVPIADINGARKVVRQKCVRRHSITLPCVRNGDASR
jgi:hypothetical protein